MELFEIIKLKIKDLKIIKNIQKKDERGFLNKLFSKKEFEKFGWKTPIRQVNYTFTKEAGTVRGMHYQVAPYSEDKLIVCISGSIIDIAIDIRPNSPTYLNNYSKILTDSNSSILIPKGFAHGFQTLENDVRLLYLHSAEYNTKYERRLNPLDPKINIQWPMNIKKMSKLDQNAPFL